MAIVDEIKTMIAQISENGVSDTAGIQTISDAINKLGVVSMPSLEAHRQGNTIAEAWAGFRDDFIAWSEDLD